ncbi:hypothetical protein V2J09_017036 [Rumex salicifolius]
MLHPKAIVLSQILPLKKFDPCELRIVKSSLRIHTELIMVRVHCISHPYKFPFCVSQFQSQFTTQSFLNCLINSTLRTPFSISPLDMENKRQPGSFPSELFGNKDPNANDVFASIFPPSKATGRNSAGSEYSSGCTRRDEVDKNGGQQPCHMSSSLYYGGQESYSQSQSSQTSGSYTTFKKDGGENDPTGASRGNWWQVCSRTGFSSPQGLSFY